MEDGGDDVGVELLVANDLGEGLHVLHDGDLDFGGRVLEQLGDGGQDELQGVLFPDVLGELADGEREGALDVLGGVVHGVGIQDGQEQLHDHRRGHVLGQGGQLGDGFRAHFRLFVLEQGDIVATDVYVSDLPLDAAREFCGYFSHREPQSPGHHLVVHCAPQRDDDLGLDDFGVFLDELGHLGGGADSLDLHGVVVVLEQGLEDGQQEHLG